MAIPSEVVEQLSKKYQVLQKHLNERQRRLWVGAEAEALGHGGRTALARATGLSVNTVHVGQLEVRALAAGTPAPLEASVATAQVRQPGAGRPLAEEEDPGLLPALKDLVEPTTRGDPMNPLCWTCKSTVQLAHELTQRGHFISPNTVGRLLEGMGYSLQSTRKRFEGAEHPDRNAQFEYINRWVLRHMAQEQPTISVDTKKKELVGNYKAPGAEWQSKGHPVEVEAYDFPSRGIGKAVPYGIYDLAHNTGWVSVGLSADTAEFAVNSIRQWYLRMGQSKYPQARHLLITADGGGSNGHRIRLWKQELQRLADEIGFMITVLHYPPGTSKWNKIEHRMFNHITMNWRGRPLVSFETVVNCIASTRTETGLRIEAALDEKLYEKGIKPSQEEMDQLRILRHVFHGDWNYTIIPSTDKK